MCLIHLTRIVLASHAILKKWISTLKGGELSIKNDDRSGKLVSVSTPINIDTAHDMILLDRQMSIKWIPKLLNVD